MEFCSKYGYNYGFAGSDEEDVEDEDVLTRQKISRKIRKTNTNIVSVRFDQLVYANEMFAGEPKKCAKCPAIMTQHSRAHVTEADGKRQWQCEFCGEQNDITNDVHDMNEIPTQDDVTFLIDPAPAKDQDASKAPTTTTTGSGDNNYITFCIDVSGSMDTMIPIRNGENQPNNLSNQAPPLQQAIVQQQVQVPVQQAMVQQQVQVPVQQQQVNFLLSEDLDFTSTSNMSRLEGVKVACIENLNTLKDQEPNKRVALVTFSDQVKFFGDGTQVRNNEPLECVGGGSNYYSRRQQQTTTAHDGDIMQNREKLTALAYNQDGNLKSIKDTHGLIQQRIKNLRTEGSTALGPGLVFSVGFSSKQAGSQIILCTDGAANVGMGAVEHGDIKEAEKFYDEVALNAKSNGVTVNVISMEGTDCKLAILGKVADKTNGTMSIVNPLNLADEFKSILNNRIVATSVKATLIVNLKYLYIRTDELEEAEGKAIEANDQAAKDALHAKRQSIVTKEIGNANIDTEITFEYGMRKLGETPAASLKELPFQLQVSYTTQDGAKAMRVYTKLQEFTADRDMAESNVHSRNLVYTHNTQLMSEQVLRSNVRHAKFLQRKMDNMREKNAWETPAAYASASTMVQNLARDARLEDLNDEAAEMVYASKKISSNRIDKAKK